MKMEKFKNEVVIKAAKSYGPDILLALLTLVIGWWLIKILEGVIKRSLNKARMDQSLKSYLVGMTNVSLKIILFISIAGILGVETSSFIAILGAAGLAIGLALKDNLTNIAAGAFILFFKPFRIGDFIEGSGVSGTVEKILMFQTFLVTPDNKVVIIPNAKLINDNLINYNEKPTRRLDIEFGIAYGDDIETARGVLLNMIKNDPKVLNDPAPEVLVSGLLDSCVQLKLRFWMNTPDYWPLKFKYTEYGKSEIEKAGLSIPFPQRDVHLFQAK